MPPPTRQRFTSTPTEADTCRTYVVPKLQTAGWETEPHSIAEQRQFTAGRIVESASTPTSTTAAFTSILRIPIPYFSDTISKLPLYASAACATVIDRSEEHTSEL